jgi:hypothetical protein
MQEPQDLSGTGWRDAENGMSTRPAIFMTMPLAIGFGAERSFYVGDRGTMLADIFVKLAALAGSATASRGCKPTL